MIDSYVKEYDKLFFDIENYSEIKEYFEQASEVIAQLILKYGEIVNQLNVSENKDKYTDLVIITFARKIMEQLDAINILLSMSSVDSAQVVLRSLIENVVELEFILKKDTKYRAIAYFLERQYQDIEKGDECFRKGSVLEKYMNNNGRKAEFDAARDRFEKNEMLLQRVLPKRQSIINMNRRARVY